MKRVCVFTGANRGLLSEYAKSARNLGKQLASRNIELVYGGSSSGLMGIIADAVLEEKGTVVGVIPKVLVNRERLHTNISRVHIVSSMHERKAKMASLADAFICMPGGLGTLEEIFEVLAWRQLDFHQKPCGLLNVCGYYDLLIEFLEHCCKQQFIMEGNQNLLWHDPNPTVLLDQLVSSYAQRIDIGRFY